MLEVLAKLRDPAAGVRGLAVSRVIGDIVTGTVAPTDIRRIRADANVISLKAARAVSSRLHRSLLAAAASAADLRAGLPAALAAAGGAGVVIGIIDDGCDFAHPNFRTATGDSRLLFLWDQTGNATARSPAEYGYGREFGRVALTSAAHAADPYTSLGYAPTAGAHGTHVMDIAAGNGRGTGVPGVAPLADLIFVQLGQPDFAEDESLGNSRRLVEAVEYVFRRAEAAGATATVVNLSLTMHGGPHDGSTLADQAFEHLLALPSRAIVVAAGNSGDGATHARGSVRATQSRTLGWEVNLADTSDNEMEIWYGGVGSVIATLRSPDGTRAITVSPGDPPRELRIANKVVASAISVRSDPTNGDHQINLFLKRSAPKGVWTVTLETTSVAPIDFDAWIERDDFGRLRQSTFVAADRDPSRTLGTLSCGSSTIVVGSNDPDDPALAISPFSSRGPTRRGAEKPDLTAPGTAISAANARGPGRVVFSGTSQAAPHVSGVVALLFAIAPHRLTPAEIRASLMNTASPRAPWDAARGRGALRCTAALRDVSGPPSA